MLVYDVAGCAQQQTCSRIFTGLVWQVYVALILYAEKIRNSPVFFNYCIQVGRIATAVGRQEFWSSVVRDPDAGMRDRLRASEILGKALSNVVHLKGSLSVTLVQRE